MFNIQLRKMREQKSLTQLELARSIGISPSTIGMYEQGRRSPDYETLIKIAQLLNVTTDYLLGKDCLARTDKDDLTEMLLKRGYDITNISTEKIADIMVKAFKLEQIYNE